MNKSIYGLKQAAKNWYEELANFLIRRILCVVKMTTAFSAKMKRAKKLFVLSWVDDLVIAGSSLEAIEELKKALENKFILDDRGKLEWFLGMEIIADSEKITLDRKGTLKASSRNLACRIANHQKHQLRTTLS